MPIVRSSLRALDPPKDLLTASIDCVMDRHVLSEPKDSTEPLGSLRVGVAFFLEECTLEFVLELSPFLWHG